MWQRLKPHTNDKVIDEIPSQYGTLKNQWKINTVWQPYRRNEMNAITQKTAAPLQSKPNTVCKLIYLVYHSAKKSYIRIYICWVFYVHIVLPSLRAELFMLWLVLDIAIVYIFKFQLTCAWHSDAVSGNVFGLSFKTVICCMFVYRQHLMNPELCFLFCLWCVITLCWEIMMTQAMQFWYANCFKVWGFFCSTV